jgi:hypothetical protein
MALIKCLWYLTIISDSRYPSASCRIPVVSVAGFGQQTGKHPAKVEFHARSNSATGLSTAQTS